MHPVMGGLAMRQCELHGTTSAQECLDIVAEYAAAQPGSRVDRRRRLVDGVLPGRHPDAAGPRLGRARPAGLPHQPRRPRHLGQHRGAGARRHRRGDSRPARRSDRARRGRQPRPGALHEGAGALVGRLLPDTSDDDMYAGLLAAQDLLFSLGITAWQDAAVGACSASTTSTRSTWRPPAPATSRRASSAPCGGSATAVPSRSPSWSRAGPRGRSAASRPPASRSCRTASRRTSPPRCSSPTSTTTAAPRHNSGLSFVDPVAAAGPRDPARRGRLPGPLPRARATARSARRWTPSRRPAPPTGPSDGRHHLAHLQVVHPDDVPRFAELGAVANIQPLWAAHEPQMDELTIPFLGARRAAWQYPFGDLLRAGVADGRRQRLVGQQPRPARGHPRRGQPGRARDGRGAVVRAQPASLSPRPLTAYTAGSAYVNHLDETTGRIEVGYLADLVDPRPRRLRRPARGDRRRAGRRDLRRRRTRLLRHLTEHRRIPDHLAHTTPEVRPMSIHLTSQPHLAATCAVLTAALLLAACSGTADDPTPTVTRARRRRRRVPDLDQRPPSPPATSTPSPGRCTPSRCHWPIRTPSTTRPTRSSPTSARACCAGTPTCRSRPAWPRPSTTPTRRPGSTRSATACTFHGGTTLTADDVVASLNLHLDPQVGSYWASVYRNVKSIEKTGDMEVTVT